MEHTLQPRVPAPKEQQAHLRDRSSGDPALAAPGPFSAIDPENFIEFLADYERRTGKRVEPERSGGGGAAGEGR